MAPENREEVVSLGVDWITCVGAVDNRLGSLLQLGSEFVTFRMRQGFERKGWGMAGFSGFQSRGVQYGVRNKETIVRLSGDLAHIAWRRTYALANNCTRLDFELTTRTQSTAPARIERHYAAARRFTRGKKKAAAVTIIRCSTGGVTLYLGKRQSAVMGRIYDKFAESKDRFFQNCVRYELEVKGELARKVAVHLASTASERQVIAARLQRFFAMRGLTLRISDESLLMPVVHRLSSDDREAYTWLAKQCRPTVRRLVMAGQSEKVLAALGLCIENGGLAVREKSELRVA